MEIIVRFASREELSRVNELRSMVNDVHVNGRPDIFRPGFCLELQTHLFGRFDAEDSNVVVALTNGVICGFETVECIRRPASAYCFARDYYHIEEFGVDADYRRKGVATALIDFARRDAKERGFDRIELDMWEFNEGALEFYEAVGFTTYRRMMELKI